MNVDKIIKGWERCKICNPSLIASPEGRKAYIDCEYTIGMYCGRDRLIYETIELLKEQQAKIESFVPVGGKIITKDVTCHVCGYRQELIFVLNGDEATDGRIRT